MKTIHVFVMMICIALSMSAADHPEGDQPSAKIAYLQLDSTYLDLGRIALDSIGSGVMRFQNTGDAPLIIHRVFTECGCTVPSFPMKPIAPGEYGTIKVRFKTRGRPLGFFRKSLRVKSNASNSRVVFTVKGSVIKP